MSKKIFIIIFIFSIGLTLTGCIQDDGPADVVDPTVCEDLVCEDLVCEECPKSAIITDDVILEVMEELLNNHFSQPTEAQLLQGALDGMIESLDDPFTTYFDLEEYESYQQSSLESYVGIGVTFRYSNGLIVVEGVYEDGPADIAGIRVNDIIAMVDGESILDHPLGETVSKIKGEEGTEITIGIIRTGALEIIDLTMTRAVIDSATVISDSFMRDGELIGYIRVTSFADATAYLFYKAVNDLEAEGITGLIVDLRNNGGGHLGTVLNMLNEFLINDGNPMFSTESYSDGELRTRDYLSSRTEARPFPIVTLVNENSASASEVFASAMQEQGDFTIVGVTTYGKGTMQNTLPVEATVGDRLHITIGKWLTSDGNWVHYDGGTNGVTPDIIVEQALIERAYKVFLLNENEEILFDTVDLRVANIQLVLNMMGYSVRTDGYYGTFTRDAILDIQSANALSETGNMDSETLLVINEALDVYQDDLLNDSQLEAAITYFLND